MPKTSEKRNHEKRSVEGKDVSIIINLVVWRGLSMDLRLGFYNIVNYFKSKWNDVWLNCDKKKLFFIIMTRVQSYFDELSETSQQFILHP